MNLSKRFGKGLWASVVVATFNRRDSLLRLLAQFEAQTLPDGSFEVVIVDDGSKEDMRVATHGLGTKYKLRVERQENAGAAVARQRGADLAHGRVLVVLDDDMQVDADYLERHLERHEDDHTVVLGKIEADSRIEDMPLFERFYARILSRLANEYERGTMRVRGHNMYTGNMSSNLALFRKAGGFDASFKAIEDEELGIRLEKAGARFVFAPKAVVHHGSDKTSSQKWLDRSFRDGVYSTRVSKKHPDHPMASPWRHLAAINPISKPLLGLSLASPTLSAPLATAILRVVERVDDAGLERLAIAGATLVYGMQYYRGVRSELGTFSTAQSEYRAFRDAFGAMHPGGVVSLRAQIQEDHAVMSGHKDKYDAREGAATETGQFSARLVKDAITNIGFQEMIAYRTMRHFRTSGHELAAQFMSRVIRHVYGSDIHYDAQFEPGVTLVHGFGMAISYAARVSRGCILFQGVTLGYGTLPGTRESGAPKLEANVHVGVGATLFGPITIGEGSKIMAGCVVSSDVPPNSIVQASSPQIAPRKGAPKAKNEG